MRLSTILMTVALGSVSGVANAAIIDPFTTAQVGSTNSETPVAGALFNSRGLWTGARCDDTNQTLQFNDLTGWCTWYNEDWSAVDLTSGRPNGFQISFDYYFLQDARIDILDISRSHSMYWDIQAGMGTANLTVTSYAGAVDFTQIIQIGLVSNNLYGSMSNFTITAVPAPGAMALLGVAGLVGSRRRR